MADFEQHKSQLLNSLAAVADSMRKCASVADAFAAFVDGGASSVDSPVALMLRDLAVAAKPDVAADDKATGGKRKRKSEAGDDTEAPKRRKRKPKDPNAPKRPASSYIFFQNEVRKKLKASNPNMSNSELLTMISKQWQEMSEEDKAVYHQFMADAKERYSQDKKAYDNRTAEEVEAANAAAAAVSIKKVKKSTKVTAPTVRKPSPPAAVVKRVAAEVPPSTEGSDISGSDDSDEHDDSEEEHDSTSSDEEVSNKKASHPPVTTVTSGGAKDKKRKVKA
ncbi:hypothetical protein F5887DRAFT_935823 [Amanita rubescens]|nr:hypothetical protein F5887DRAFT_935823 [Amanita rubescens]